MDQSEAEKEQLETLKKKVLSSILDKEAFERINRVKLVNPTLANQVEMYLIQMYQAGKLGETITDGTMKEILQAVQAGKKDFNIKFR